MLLKNLLGPATAKGVNWVESQAEPSTDIVLYPGLMY